MTALSRRRVAIFLLLLLWPKDARAEDANARGRGRAARSAELVNVPVRVVDVAGGRAYVEPGSERGLREGDELRFPEGNLRVVDVTRKWAVVSLGKQRLAVGTRGVAAISAQRPETVVLQLPPPTPLASFRGQWRAVVKPSESQHPRPVPLRARQRAASRVLFQDAFYGAFPLDGRPKFIGNEVRVQLHVESFVTAPLAFDVDLRAQTFAGDGFLYRPGAAAREVARVREFSLAYGRKGDFRGALGRLRAASTFVGQLDGLRLEAPLTEGLRLSAFAGGAPQVVDGLPSSEVLRFGSELTYEAPASSLRPRLVAGAYASRFEGTLDERRVYAAFDLLPSRSLIGATAELSFFDADNPWQANEVELTLASLDTDFVFGVFHLGGRFELRRPERSRFLLSLFPVEWLCWADPALARAPCSGDDAHYSWLANAGIRIGKFSADWGAQSSFTRGTDATTFGGYTTLRFLDLIGRTHLDLGMTAFTGSVQRELAVTAAPGIVLADGSADITLRYRAAAIRYRADLGFSFGHSLGAGLWAAANESVAFEFGADWVRELGIDVAVVQGLLSFRPGD